MIIKTEIINPGSTCPAEKNAWEWESKCHDMKELEKFSDENESVYFCKKCGLIIKVGKTLPKANE